MALNILIVVDEVYAHCFPDTFLRITQGLFLHLWDVRKVLCPELEGASDGCLVVSLGATLRTRLSLDDHARDREAGRANNRLVNWFLRGRRRRRRWNGKDPVIEARTEIRHLRVCNASCALCLYCTSPGLFKKNRRLALSAQSLHNLVFR